MGQDAEHGLAGVSAQGLTRLQLGCQPGYILTWSFISEESSSRLIEVVGKMHFLVALQWRAQPLNGY